ncbi:MAG: chromosomal replication initiator protein DnaA [Candidatus Handelsmanbacteria bacterium RIFCSPLOWO2_12_FULL_64_10]|uniref:Chromosomal replication initiator protein DnaA n=1 Tax=Handelsmanbacteria sp. (strain RIFCSPLOWO2_12_FULL_64_10) TaxID=1817868 RepID=A0A1F6CL70_HANXR|nr:MAG: chromosomal replication initiator protein DnaA [Candidatus Handelsmanbacteria bacterium RIFCSPLOWO2_12_FULL_64_10]
MSDTRRDEVLRVLQASVRPDIYDVWCRTLQFEDDPDGGVTIPVPNGFYKEMYERELRAPIEDAFVRTCGRVPRIVFQIRDLPARPPAAPASRPSVHGLHLSASLTFDRFIVGPSNRFAHAAALGVAESPGAIYNPLFIHGAVGLGKTHLLQAICHEVLVRTPHLKIHYLSCEDFVNAYIAALQKKDLAPFRSRFRAADMLVMDDIHFLAGKQASQDEFFHTYNALHGSGKQVVLASDAPPKDIVLIQEQLLSRFKSGLVARVDTPTFETRVALLQARAAERGHPLPEDVVQSLAGAIQTNFRELEGAVTKLIAYSAVSRQPIGLELAREVLKDLLEAPRAAATVTDIQRVVSEYFHIRTTDLSARRWTKATSLPRQLAIYLARRHTCCSLKEIGAHFGGKDHSTVSYAIDRIEKLAAEQPQVRSHLETLSRTLAGKL